MPLRITGEDWNERVNCEAELGRMAQARGSRVDVVVVVRIDGRKEVSRARGAVRDSIAV